MKLPLTPIRCLYRGVDLYGEKVGVVSGEARYTYAQFGERSERLAAGLLAEGVRRGDRVAFLSFNNNQLLEGYYGAPLIRAIPEPRRSIRPGVRKRLRPLCGAASRHLPYHSTLGVDRRPR